MNQGIKNTSSVFSKGLRASFRRFLTQADFLQFRNFGSSVTVLWESFLPINSALNTFIGKNLVYNLIGFFNLLIGGQAPPD